MESLNRLHGKLNFRFVACIFGVCGILGFVADKSYGAPGDLISSTYMPNLSCRNYSVYQNCYETACPNNPSCKLVNPDIS